MRKSIDERIDYYKWAEENTEILGVTNREVKIPCPSCGTEIGMRLDNGFWNCFRTSCSAQRGGNYKRLVNEYEWTSPVLLGRGEGFTEGRDYEKELRQL